MIVIDEIQKIPALTDEVHRLIEEKKWKFILTGSSARKLRRSHANLLAGRALNLSFYPLVARELGDDFNLSDSLRFGHLPSINSEPDKEKFLQAYLNTYLREEIIQEGIVRNVDVFSRFLESASFSQGAILNVRSVAKDVGKDPKVINEYFQILEDLLIAVRLPVFHQKARRKLTTRPKFYFFDVGVYRAIRPIGPLDDENAINGHCLETLIFQELRALNDHLSWGFHLYFWHTRENLEIDFVLYGKKGLVAIEVKSSNRFSDDDLKALRLFKSEYRMAKCFFIYGGDEKNLKDEKRIIPVRKFIIKPEDYFFNE